MWRTILLCTDLSNNVDVKYKLVVDSVGKRCIGLHFIPTEIMITDIITKNLKHVKLAQLIRLTKMQ